MPHALLVDDDTNTLSGLAELVAHEGFSVATASTLREARASIAERHPDVVLLDLCLPDGSGMDLFDDVKSRSVTEVVLITGHATLESSIEALRLGAGDYLIKPVNV
jgi:two-component system response regulator AtoC